MQPALHAWLGAHSPATKDKARGRNTGLEGNNTVVHEGKVNESDSPSHQVSGQADCSTPLRPAPNYALVGDDAVSGNGLSEAQRAADFTVANATDETASESNALRSPGHFPPRKDTACAEVLSRALSGEALTSLDAVFDAATTRLPAHVWYLENEYGWRFERIEKAIGCSDGRLVTITVYSLAEPVIAQAMAAGGDEWCTDVRCARRALRNRREEAKARAAIANERAAKSRKAKPAPGQADLFELQAVAQ